MTKITIAPNASGTGTFTLAAPNSNTDRTFTLPDATGEVLTSAGGTVNGPLTVSNGGQIFEVRNADTYSRFTASNGSAQLGLFRSGEAAGGFYIGGDASNFRVYNQSFQPIILADPTGRVTMPYQPAFNAKLISSANGNTTAVANIDLPYSFIRLNTGGNYDASTYRFTAPVSGNYFFALSISFFANGTTGRRSAGFYVNGGLYEYVDFTTTSNYDMVELATVIPLSVNDYVSVRFLTLGVGDQYWGGGAPVGAFKGYLIG